jgi:hypothetical protein
MSESASGDSFKASTPVSLYSSLSEIDAGDIELMSDQESNLSSQALSATQLINDETGEAGDQDTIKELKSSLEGLER